MAFMIDDPSPSPPFPFPFPFPLLFVFLNERWTLAYRCLGVLDKRGRDHTLALPAEVGIDIANDDCD